MDTKIFAVLHSCEKNLMCIGIDGIFDSLERAIRHAKLIHHDIDIEGCWVKEMWLNDPTITSRIHYKYNKALHLTTGTADKGTGSAGGK